MGAVARVTLGLACAICAAAWIALAIMLPQQGSIWVAYGFAAFCATIALACFGPGLRAIAFRVIALTILTASGWYLVARWNAPMIASQRGQPSLLKAILFFVVFGMPSLYVLIRGKYPSWGRGARAFQGRVDSQGGMVQSDVDDR